MNFDLLDDLYQYFTSKDGYTQLDKYIYSFLQEEYLKEQNRTDSLTIENIRSKRYNSDDEFFDKNLINDDQNGVFTEKMESQKYNLGSNHLDENFLVDKFLDDLEKLIDGEQNLLLVNSEDDFTNSAQLELAFEKDFLNVDNIYKHKYMSFLTQQDYQRRKQIFIKAWLEKNSFDNKSDLDQSLAIGSVSSHVQVVARAGSGKTSTLVNHALFLQRHCNIKSSEILLLAFNKKAVQEVKERLQKYFQSDIPHVITFHALAYRLVHPDETLIFDDVDGQQEKSHSLQSVFDDYFQDPIYYDQIKCLMTKKFRDAWQTLTTKGYNLTPEEMYVYRRSSFQMGIDGYNYKSGGEKVIADFLFEHDIPFKYERNFWWNGVNYHPDFTIVKEINQRKGIVVEYFGLKGDPNYDEQSEQKRKYWQNQSEYFFVELNPKILKRHGRKGMEDQLHHSLTEQIGLQFKRLSDQEIWEKIKDRAINSFDKAMTNFIGRCRKKCWTPEQLKEKIDWHNLPTNQDIAGVEHQFLTLAKDFYSSYLERLQQTSEEDFDGLMQRAAKVVDEGNTVFLSSQVQGDLKELKYIMIDEYQDFSLLFHNLVTAIRKQNPEALFFCVGDDWQAINSFAGADLYYYKNFAKIFKPSHTLPITTNYRSGSQIVEIGNKLMANRGIPAQPSTQTQGKIQLVNIAKFQMTPIEEQEHGYDLTAAIIRLTGQLIQDGKQVTLLSKKNLLQGVDGKIKKLDLFRKYILKKLNLVGDLEHLVDISTTHKYKGKERQAVIILDAYNYPSVHPESIFFRIFGDDENKLLEDERRLFYVALTRAKEELYIVIDNFKMSPFVVGLTSKIQLQELDWKSYPVFTNETRFVTVKVSNQKGRESNGTYNIRELLKADGFKWNGTSKSWNKVESAQKLLANGSRLQYLSERNWSSKSNRIEVNLCNEQEEILALYLANNGNWTCDFDNFNQLESDKCDYSDIPF